MLIRALAERSLSIDIDKYFFEIVLPTYKEFERDRVNRRRALLAALTLYHLLDYVNAERAGNKGSLGVLLQKTRERCASFRAIEALAIGTKHVKVRGPDQFAPDQIAIVAAGTVLDRREIKYGTVREFKTEKSMLWLEFKNQIHFVDVDLFAALTYLANEFGLYGIDDLELPVQFAYRDTAE